MSEDFDRFGRIGGLIIAVGILGLVALIFVSAASKPRRVYRY